MLQAKQNDVVITELENMLQVNCKLEYKCKPISARQFLAGIQVNPVTKVLDSIFMYIYVRK